MPETPYLVAAVAVLTAIAFAVWASRRGNARMSDQRAAADQARDELAETLAETRAQLTAARSDVDRLTEHLGQARAEMEAVRAAATHTDSRHVEVFVNLSRRLQSLVHREIKLLDALENEVEDPDLLKGLFQVDHLATRIRRHAENLAVLGGSVSRRQWSRPVALTEVLRSAIAEVEYYSRVKLVPPIDGTVPGHAVASIIHLVAELIENATMFAPPHTNVLLRTQQVTSGVAIEVEDRGLGMQRADQDRVNQLLANPDFINLDDLLRDGRIGLYVVSMIARQHGIVVQLQTNIYGGTQAVVILPRLLIGSSTEPVAATPRQESLPPALREQLAAQDRYTLAQALPAKDRRSLAPAPSAPETVPAREHPPQHAAPFRIPAAQTSMAQTSMAPIAPAAHAYPESGHSEAGYSDAGYPEPGYPEPGYDAHGNVAPTAAYPQIAAPRTADRPAVPVSSSARPPLPRRHSQTHMAPQLKLGPPGPIKDPAGEHNPGLMASFMNGVSQGEAHAPENHG